MGIFSKFENRMEDTFEGAAGKMSKAPISPVQIAKKAEKQMRRETMVGAGREYAPTLYTVLVNPDDDERLFGYYPTLAGETETYLSAKAMQEGLVMDGEPLVRFVVDDGLKHGKFDVIAELVAAPIVEQLRDEEMQRYGIAPSPQPYSQAVQGQQPYGQPNQVYAQDAWGNGYEAYAPAQQEPAQQEQPQRKPPLPYVPEEEIDRSIDYGEYTFNSEDFEDYREKANSEGLDAMEASAYGQQGYAQQQVVPQQQPPQQAYAQPQQAQQPAQPQQQRAYAQPQQQQQQPQQMRPANTAAFVAGGPAASQGAIRARLIDLAYQRPYDLAGTVVTLGREAHNDIVVQDMNASRKHAELRLTAQGIWTITDLKSMNGTLVNGISVASHPLYPGDIVTIGKTDFQFSIV